MGETLRVSTIILGIMFLLLPVDMVNGFLLKNNIILPLSIGQFYKIILLFFILLSFMFKPNKLIFSFGLFFSLLLPSIFQVFTQFKIGFLLEDFIKVARYLTPVFSFMFFVNYIKKGNKIDLLFKLINFSFIIFCGNILLKYIGLGYPMYNFNAVGSKGYFYAGNETSVVLIILSSILAYKTWLEKDMKKYFFLFLFSIFIGVTISSKTGILGVFITFILIPIELPTLRISLRKIKVVFYSLLLLIFTFFILFSDIVQNSSLFSRFNYFWNKLDLVTFVFSNRNNYFVSALEMYNEEYNFVEKIIGVGQTKYETLNVNSIVEIDIADIFFAYGFIGLILFIVLILYILSIAKFLKKQGKYPYSGLVYLMIFILIGISTMAGHVFSSGMAAIFLGLLFSLMYIKEEKIEN